VTASIGLRGVSQRFGVTWTLTDIDLDLVPGATGLLGPNGAGKTTLLRPFASALASTQGRVSVLGQVGLCGDPAKRIRAMSGGPRGCGSWPCRSCCWPDASRLGRTSLDRPDTSFPPISSLYAVRCHGRPGITGETS
jgi:energy-coupling factor transporter ATP-binding protein EcfA2